MVLLVPGILSPSSVRLGVPGSAGAALCLLRAAGRVSGKRNAFPGVQMRTVRHGTGEGAARGSSIAGLREPAGRSYRGVCVFWASGLLRGQSLGIKATVVQVGDVTAGCQPFLSLPPWQSLGSSDTVMLVWMWSKCWRSSWCYIWVKLEVLNKASACCVIWPYLYLPCDKWFCSSEVV